MTRYAAVFSAFREAAPAAAQRIADYVAATTGSVLDEPATARALAGFFVRALDNGGTDADEVRQLTGLDEQALRDLARN